MIKYLALALLAIFVVLEIQIFMLLYLDGLNLKLWKAQINYNEGVYGVISDEATSTTK